MSWSCEQCGGDRNADHGSCRLQDTLSAAIESITERLDKIASVLAGGSREVQPPEPHVGPPCDLCGNDLTWHGKHRPRHPFTLNPGPAAGPLTDVEKRAAEGCDVDCTSVSRLVAEVRRLREEAEIPCDRLHVADLSCSCGDSTASRGGDHYDGCDLRMISKPGRSKP